MSLGKFITLEGGEGVGKSTNLKFIHQHLQSLGIKVIATREPGGTDLAEKLRTLMLDQDQEAITAKAELLLMFAARSQHIQHVIRPALEAGTWVLCDRFTDATYAYQGAGRSINESSIAWLENFIQESLRPNLTLLLHAPLHISTKRVLERGGADRFEQEKQQFYERVQQNYLSRARKYPERIKVINADVELQQVQLQISEILKTCVL